MFQVVIKSLTVWLKNKTSLICLGVMIVLFIPVFRAVDFDPFLSIILLIVAVALAVAASFIVSALISTGVVLTSGARVKKLAERYPELAELEKKRSSLVGIRLLFFAVCVVAFFVGVMALGAVGAGAVSIGAPFAYLMIIRKKEVELRDSFKQAIVIDELDRAFTDVRFDPRGHFSLEEIEGLRLFSDLHRTGGNDLIDAKRGEIPFLRCDTHLENVYVYTDNNGYTKTVYGTIFKGSVFRFELSERVPVRLLAATGGFENLREADDDLKKLIGWAGERSVETEMDEFNRRFDVYCSDQSAARILLTPQMIEGINRVGQITRHEFAMLFEGTRLYLFLSTPGADSFEIAISSTQSMKKQQEIVTAQVALIAAIVDNMYFKGAGRNYEDIARTQAATEMSSAIADDTPARVRIAAKRSPSAARGKFLAFKRLRFSFIRLTIFLTFIFSCIYALFACPNGIALSIGTSGAGNFVPVLPYMIFGGAFMGAFCIGSRKSSVGLPAAALLLLIHLAFFVGSVMA